MELTPARRAHDLYWRMLGLEVKEPDDTSTEDQRLRAKSRAMILIKEMMLEVTGDRLRYWQEVKQEFAELMKQYNVYDPI